MEPKCTPWKEAIEVELRHWAVAQSVGICFFWMPQPWHQAIALGAGPGSLPIGRTVDQPVS